MKRVFIVLVALTVAASPVFASASGDRRRPEVALDTASNQVFLLSTQNPLLEHAIRGAATDDRSGIREVHVRFRPCAQPEGPCGDPDDPRHVVNGNLILGGPEMTCTNRRRSCTWSVPAPIAPGVYEIAAWAFDRAGNRSKTRTVRILVA